MKPLQRILVTGANGLIGRYVIDKLLANDYVVIALYHAAPPALQHENLSFIKTDLINDEIDTNIDDINTIIHCAAVMPSKQYSDDMCCELNKLMDASVFNYCLKHTETKIIYMSGVYIEDYNEADLAQKSKYLFAKLQSERSLKALKNPNIVFRISSPFGVYQKTQNVLKIFIENAIAGRSIVLHGTGRRMQDFIFADDIADAVLLSLKKDFQSEVLNLCSSSPVTMQQLALMLKKINPAVKIEFSGMNDPQENYKASFNNASAKQYLNWHPKTTLEQGIQIMYNYFQK